MFLFGSLIPPGHDQITALVGQESRNDTPGTPEMI